MLYRWHINKFMEYNIHVDVYTKRLFIIIIFSQEILNDIGEEKLYGCSKDPKTYNEQQYKICIISPHHYKTYEICI